MKQFLVRSFLHLASSHWNKFSQKFYNCRRNTSNYRPKFVYFSCLLLRAISCVTNNKCHSAFFSIIHPAILDFLLCGSFHQERRYFEIRVEVTYTENCYNRRITLYLYNFLFDLKLLMKSWTEWQPAQSYQCIRFRKLVKIEILSYWHHGMRF